MATCPKCCAPARKAADKRWFCPRHGEMRNTLRKALERQAA